MNWVLKYLFFSCIIFIFSCRKDQPQEALQPINNAVSNTGVYIINEGNYQFGNSKISYYDIGNATITEDLYQPANNVPLGDVCQSMCIFNNIAYIVVNNSGKIMAVNPLTFKTTASITGFVSPRYFLPISNNKAYVTDLISNSISIVNLINNTISGSISCPGWTEELILAYGKAYVTNKENDKVYVINTATDIIEDSIQVGYGSNSIREDLNGKLWVLCSGSEIKNLYASLHCINPISNQVEKSFQFPSLTDNPWKLNINTTNNILYFLNKGVFQMEINLNNLPENAFIAEGTKQFYGIGIEPMSDILYVSDAIDYVQKGKIYRYNKNGTLINSFLAGIIPGDFYFK